MEEERQDKQLVIDFFKTKEIEARHFPKKVIFKKPDFELYLKKNLFGYCELKSITTYEFNGLRHDPTYNKIQSKIHEAAKQFKSVNPDHIAPNILYFVNHCANIGAQDLWYVLTGNAMPPNQTPEPIDVLYLKRLLKSNDLTVIDYFIWADAKRINKKFFINADSTFTTELKENISSKAFEQVRLIKEKP